MVRMEERSFSPLWLQLSMDTTASGALQVAKRWFSSAQTTAIAEVAFSGPLSMSAWMNGKKSPAAFLSA